MDRQTHVPRDVLGARATSSRTSACSWRRFTRQKPRRLARSLSQISSRHDGQRTRPLESARLLVAKSASLLEQPWMPLPRQGSDRVLNIISLYLFESHG